MMYHVIQADGSHLGPYDLPQLQQMQNQGQVLPDTPLLDLATGHQIEARQVPGLFQSMAWRDPDAQKMPPSRIVGAVLMYPIWIIVNLVFYRWGNYGEDDIFILNNYCGIWGKVYIAALMLIVAGVFIAVYLPRFHR